jgi:hypothetical protein
MIVIGITTLRAKILTGWKRFVPIIVGLWFPLMVIPAITIGTTTTIAGIYSALAFAMLGVSVYNGERPNEVQQIVRVKDLIGEPIPLVNQPEGRLLEMH